MTHALDGKRFNGGWVYGTRGSWAARLWGCYWASVIWCGISGFSAAGEGLTARNEHRTGIP